MENEKPPKGVATTEQQQKIPKEYADLFAVGAHFGHEKARVHPSMFPFIFGVRNGVHIINVEKTVEKIKEAATFLEEQAKLGKSVLFVGTKLSMREPVKAAAIKSGMYYMVERWPGGVLTNWKTFSNTIAHLAELEEKKQSEEWEKYTKYERMMMDREIDKLNLQWEGIKELKKIPNVVIVVDMKHDELAVADTRTLSIPLVAITDTNVDASIPAYPIPASDDSVQATTYILDHLVTAIVKGKALASAEKEKAEKEKVEKDNTEEK